MDTGSRIRGVGQTLIGRRRSLPGLVGLDVTQLRLPSQQLPLDPEALLLPLDLLPDLRSFAGVPLAASPLLDFARRVPSGAVRDPTDTEFFRVAARLPERTPTAIAWGPAQDCAEFIYQIHCQQHGWCETREQPPVVVAELRDGRHMVLSGVRVLAAAIALGRTTWEVQVAPENEVRAVVREHTDRLLPRRMFTRNLTLAGELGSPEDRHDPAAAAVARELKAAPLVPRGHVYQPLPFPEFAHLVSQANDSATYQRLGMILEVCPEPRGMRYLDLGCNVGFFAFSLARRGAVVTGVDLDERFIALARRVAAIKDVSATFVAAPLEPALFAADGALGASLPPWDLVSCFSTLQWVIEQHGEEFAVELLEAISERSRALLVDVPVNCGNPRLSAAPGWELCRTADLVRAAGYTHCRHVGTVVPYRTDRRHVFYCWKDD